MKRLARALGRSINDASLPASREPRGASSRSLPRHRYDLAALKSTRPRARGRPWTFAAAFFDLCVLARRFFPRHQIAPRRSGAHDPEHGIHETTIVRAAGTLRAFASYQDHLLQFAILNHISESVGIGVYKQERPQHSSGGIQLVQQST